jgi:CMP-N-acetylneuraminic acid synthetase
MNIVGLIPARGGSRGVPRKHLRPLGGKPVIVWTIEAALKSRRLSRVVVTTGDQEIAAVSRSAGAEVPFVRPAELERDDALLPDVIRHAEEELERGGAPIDLLVILFPTCPFRTTRHIDEAIDLVLSDRHHFYALGAGETPHHPYRCVRVANGRAQLVLDRPEVEWPTIHKLNQSITIHKKYGGAFRGEKYLTFDGPLGPRYYHPKDLRPCRKVAVFMDETASIDIDEPIDYFRAQVARQYGLGEA